MNQSSPSGEHSRTDLISAIDEQGSLVRIRRNDLSFNELADMYNNEELTISPEYQRLFRWSDSDQSRFIESLLLGLPIPPIFLIENEDHVYELVDGLQRLSTYLRFTGQLKAPAGLLDEAGVDEAECDEDASGDYVREKSKEKYTSPLTLIDCDIVPALDGSTCETLPTAMAIKLRRCYVRAEILEKGSDAKLRYHLFKRLNRGGEQLTNQEVRNATIRLLDSRFIEFVGSLTRTDDFRRVTHITDRRSRNAYRAEIVVRFFAYKNAIEDYNHLLNDFLDEYVEKVATADVAVRAGETPRTPVFDYAAEEQLFLQVFSLCSKIEEINGWDQQIFGSVKTGSDAPMQQFSGFHFDAIVTALASVVSEITEENHLAIAQATKEAKASSEFRRMAGGGRNYQSAAVGRTEFFVKAYRQVLSA